MRLIDVERGLFRSRNEASGYTYELATLEEEKEERGKEDTANITVQTNSE